MRQRIYNIDFIVGNSRTLGKFKVMGAAFDKQYSGYQNIIQANRVKFETINKLHIGQHSSDIFSTYWFLEGSSNQFEGLDNDKIVLTTKPAYRTLPDDLKNLIR